MRLPLSPLSGAIAYVIGPFALFVAAQSPAQNAGGPVPPGYRLVYEQHFDSIEALRGLVCTDTGAWRFAADDTSFALELAQPSQYQPAVRSPLNIALVADLVLGDFVL